MKTSRKKIILANNIQSIFIMSEENSETTVDRKLFEIFEEAFDLNYSFETCNDPTNSPEFQVNFNLRCFCIIVLFNLKCVIYIFSNYEIHFQSNIKKCIRLFEDCTRLVSICGLFSSNEKYTELPTDHLKYFMLPFFLGTLSQKLCGGSRSEVVEIAEVYFK